MTKLIIDEIIFEMFPDVRIGVVSFQGIVNRGENGEILTALRFEQSGLPERFGATPVTDHPHIAPWRDAYRKFGAKPKDHPSSIENLVRRSLKGQALRHINLLVDIYNTISLRYLLPVGGEDLNALRGDVRLTLAGEGESAVKLLGETEERAPKRGEVIYRDELGAICRRWNWKEADRTKLTEHTEKGLLVMEGLPPVDSLFMKRAIDDLINMVQRYCGGEIREAILDQSQTEIVL